MISGILLIAGNILFRIIELLILANVVMSWIRPNPDNKLVQTLHSVTEPMLAPFRRIGTFGAVDFSPFIVLLLIQFVVSPLYRMLIGLIF